ncbi:flagellar basal body rod modification protein [Massilia solisilvae]|uniref:Basal-body rod modification protein FlgD n=1 Tax=Massilia solisilvae TaxID=1811225 RepID=A0ABT2BIH6_9BURK|nr:flagellar hook capping FlgD N-terminal domain-containing protein [Massilia solisilvae]MCS0608319.1 flagellar basal body rod modification protein [Massilia solisilvae]
MQTSSTNLFNKNTAGAASDKVATSAPSNENRDMFTKLLVAQIRNQDPLSPSDPTQFVNQLSQLSQTEALQSLAQTNSTSASLLQSLQVLAMGAQVGSQVSVATGTVRLDGDKVSGSVMLSAGSAATKLVLTGADGAAHEITLPPHGPGALPFTIDPVALGLASGSYTLQAQAADGTAPQVEVTGRLDSVRMSASGGVLLQVANIGEIDPPAITGFNGKAGAAQVAALTPTN